ncbi:hypothetical protein K0M31_010986 [Melipona bicolor]|uniref:Uncharacterized protein n=1 Tax=Melipona bicolor TaxID=60889 RepID=A0AA40FKG9_9HYME|nr:hypothetical protein K0M31_010986 [Melipona bicolor]
MIQDGSHGPRDQEVLQRDIEAHGRIVSSVVKLGDKVFNQQQKEQQQQQQQEQDREKQEEQEQRELSQALRTAKSLERRWHLLFLRALEWQCHIETLVSRISSKPVERKESVAGTLEKIHSQLVAD